MEFGVIKLVNRLDPERFTCSICCLRFRMAATETLLNSRVRVFELQEPSGRNFSVIPRLAALLRRERIDIVHSHNWPTFFYTVAAAAIAGVPVVVHGEHGQEVGIGASRKRLLACRVLRQLVSRLVTVSKNISRDLVGAWKLDPECVTTIPNGVDIEAFGQRYPLDDLRRSLDLAPEDRVVMSVGVLRPVKDHGTLIRAFARVCPRIPEAKLVLVGGDQQHGLRPELEALVEELGIRAAVRFLGVRHDIPQLLALCDVYVNTSLYEGMSNTILEAMAARKPVVATAVGGTPDLIRDQVTGYLVDPGDDERLAERLEHLLNDRKLAGEIGAAGRAHVERHHSISRMLQDYTTLYEDLIERQRLKRVRSIKERSKQWLGRAICWSGLKYLSEAVSAPRLVILAYHRVLPLDRALRYPFPAMVMPTDLFEPQIAYLARHHTVLDFPEAIRLLQSERLPKRAVVLTFDDGYRDNYEHALPVLKKYDVPATFFVVTGVLDGAVRLWWEDVAKDVEELAKNRSTLAAKESQLPDWMAVLLQGLQKDGRPDVIAQEAVRRLNGLSRRARRQSLQALSVVANRGAGDGCDAMLTWDQVREMHRSGMHIGSHTVTHAFLDELPPEEAQREIAGSVTRLQEELGVPVRMFAYPRGRSCESIKPLLRQCGIEAAVTTTVGRNAPGGDLLELRRLDAGYCKLNGGFDAAVLEAELQGWFTRARERVNHA
jgi:sugar transferase (PEP-CTERM/EpsH1 system associated)